jgi:nicotinamide-nucleotide amidase
MNVAIVSIGTELLLTDILNTNAAHVTRRLRENKIPISCRITIGDDQAAIASLIQELMPRYPVVITLGGLGTEPDDFTRPAIAEATGRQLLEEPEGALSDSRRLGEGHTPNPGLLIEEGNGTLLIALPGNPREMAYLFETEVLPCLRQRMETTAASAWTLLRTAGAMESTLEQQLADLHNGHHRQITFASYAGQTDIRLWVEGESQERVQQDLAVMEQEVIARLGDHVYGREGDRLEAVLVRHLAISGVTLTVAECYTNRSLARTFARSPGSNVVATVLPEYTGEELSQHLGLPPLDGEFDLTRWCRLAAECLRNDSQTRLALVVYNHVTPGGVQVLVTLASEQGVSVIQRSFGGHPENIDHWASTLGLVHVRRWLLAHAPEYRDA